MKFKVNDRLWYTDGKGNKKECKIVCIYSCKKDYNNQPDNKTYLIVWSNTTEEWHHRDDISIGNKVYNWWHKKLKRKFKVGDIVKIHDFSEPCAGIVRATRIDEPNNYYVEYLYSHEEWVEESALEEDIITTLTRLQGEIDA